MYSPAVCTVATPAMGASLVPCSLTREWRNWQTRRIQVPVPARAWGFKSPLAHSTQCVGAAVGVEAAVKLFDRGAGHRFEGRFVLWSPIQLVAHHPTLAS